MQILKSVPLKLLRCNLKGTALTILIRIQQLCYTFLWHYKISIKNSSTQQSTDESIEFRAALGLQETKRQKRQNVKYTTLKLWKCSQTCLCVVIRWTWSRWEENPSLRKNPKHCSISTRLLMRGETAESCFSHCHFMLLPSQFPLCSIKWHYQNTVSVHDCK